MRLRRFSVSGYKNLTQPIVLDGLGPIEVIHGANNVGKSNLLQAMELLFLCLPAVGDGPSSAGREILSLDAGRLAPDPRSLFNLDRPTPITLRGTLEVPAEEIVAAGVQDAGPLTEIDVEASLTWDAAMGGAFAQITRLRFADGKDVAQTQSNEEVGRARFFARFLSKNVLVREGPSDRFAILGVQRGLEDTPVPRQKDNVPLSVEMYDCRDSSDRVRRDRWRAFVRAMEEFQDVTGKGEFEVVFPRSEPKARLVFDTEKMRISLSLLGSGVQQVTSLLGHLLVRNASIVAIEEPELNLRWDLQDRLRQALAKLVSEPHGVGGVDQIFITSHSPAFETGGSFWLMETKDGVPTISRRPASELPLVLGSGPRHLGLPEQAAQSYVTSQGVVKLPDHVAATLGVQHGGGVVFVDAEPRGVRIVSNDQYLDELGLTEGGAAEDGS